VKRLLVTGGSGMIGQHVAAAAAARGHHVRLADHAWPPAALLWAPGDERVTFDIRDPQACRDHVVGVDTIVHCAAVVGPARARVDPLQTLAVNVNGTANLLEAAHAQGARLLSMSTATLYGHRAALEPLDEDARVDPLTVYDGTKLMAEVHCTAHRRTYGSDVASFRTGFVFGRGTQIGEYFLPRVLRGEAVDEAAGRDHPCDFTYVLDLAEALVAAAEAPALAHSIYNVTGGRIRTRGELAQAVRDRVPGARITQGPGVDPARHLRGACVIERARQDFGWSPRFTLEAGLADWLERLERAI
jgi:nucleoside-diphosphate-sugar epimerase